ncbi:MAG: tripartite tricarboxylate transporter substrate-binding protein [Acidovorax sp.]|nr:tripartite tricarboxylate transporter substrate-binding protein [Acidovorax sp.]
MSHKEMKTLKKSMYFCLALLASTNSLAAWPEKPITLVAPFAAGGNADIMARQIAQSLGTKLGQPVIVENKPGAGSMLGTQHVARSKDGHTFLLGSFANVLNEFFYRNKTFDLRKELIPVTQLVSIPNYFATATDSKIESMADLIAQAKAKPGALTCATNGVQSTELKPIYPL